MRKVGNMKEILRKYAKENMPFWDIVKFMQILRLSVNFCGVNLTNIVFSIV